MCCKANLISERLFRNQLSIITDSIFGKNYEISVSQLTAIKRNRHELVELKKKSDPLGKITNLRS